MNRLEIVYLYFRIRKLCHELQFAPQGADVLAQSSYVYVLSVFELGDGRLFHVKRMRKLDLCDVAAFAEYSVRGISDGCLPTA